jgi:hypothetical protein
MNKYPASIPDEFATIRSLLKSRDSLARYGDGEFKIACGGGCVSQDKNSDLTQRLKSILSDPPAGLTVAIPRIVGRYDLWHAAPKLYEFWNRISRTPDYVALLSDRVRYGSSFITRLDNAPHIHCADYWRAVQKLFDKDDVVVVSGQYKDAVRQIVGMAKSVQHIAVPGRDAWKEYGAIRDQCMRFGSGTTFYLSCGPTATVLAADLCAAGFRALDMGAMHRFWMGGRQGMPS